MCGICGYVGNGNAVQLERMMAAMVHRGPDDSGRFIAGEVALGMRRLSIIDVEGGGQPITDEDGGVVVVFNGEIYNYRELRDSLLERGHKFTTRTDTEVLVHLYQEYGANLTEHLRGMFAFALWDRAARRLLLVRDRLGIKPLYVVERPGVLFFASELKALLAAGVIEARLEPQAVASYASFPCVPAPATIIAGVEMLLPAHLLVYENGAANRLEYWRLRFDPPTGSGDAREYIQRTRTLLEESVRLRLRSDVPLGAFLSGGIDSSAVVGLMGTLLDRPVNTYSIAFTGKEPEFAWFNELSHAKKVAECFGTNHQEIVISGEDIHRKLARMVWAMDQPSGDALQYYLVSELAARGVKVALSGTGGDEVFAGYEWFKELRFLNRLDRMYDRLPCSFRNALRRMLSGAPPTMRATRLFRKAGTFTRGTGSFAERYRLNRRMYRREEWDHLFNPRFAAQLDNQAPDEIDRYVGATENYDIVDKVSFLQIKTDLVNLLIRDQDAVSMAHSLEVRLPLIDHVLIEFIACTPPHLKLHGNMEKYILREAVKDILPADIAGRRKKGFMFPMHLWMRNELAPVVDGCLNRASVERRGIFNWEFVRSLTARFEAGKEPFFKVWNMVALELWCRMFLDRTGMGPPDFPTAELVAGRHV
ncbi:asparagine synthase (glutamine-hydrolyzing) [bacterium]|nr:asparagine synthase (glutamine-hydrolyzing) [candidate division CSSED10-310 bacterium]